MKISRNTGAGKLKKSVRICSELRICLVAADTVLPTLVAREGLRRARTMQPVRLRSASLRSVSKGTVVLVTLYSVLLVPRGAHADVKSCINSHESGQVEAKAGRLKRAAELFGTCGAMEDCPTAVRAECVELYRDVEKSLPTVIFSAVDEHGKDITNVQVYATDQLLTSSLDGRALALDPGKYSLKFVFPKGESVDADVLVREGEKNRVINVAAQVRTPAKPVASVQERGSSEADATNANSRAALPMGVWISAGVGAAAIASWGVFALLGRSKQSKVDECSPKCDASLHGDFDAMRRDYLIADISLGVAVASAGAATWFLVSSNGSPSTPTAVYATKRSARLSLLPLFSVSGAGLVVSAEAF